MLKTIVIIITMILTMIIIITIILHLEVDTHFCIYSRCDLAESHKTEPVRIANINVIPVTWIIFPAKLMH